jgi:hypothetical protein
MVSSIAGKWNTPLVVMWTLSRRWALTGVSADRRFAGLPRGAICSVWSMLQMSNGMHSPMWPRII